MGNAKENFKQALYAVIETYGTEILDDSRRINALLMDYAPGRPESASSLSQRWKKESVVIY